MVSERSDTEFVTLPVRGIAPDRRAITGKRQKKCVPSQSAFSFLTDFFWRTKRSLRHALYRSKHAELLFFMRCHEFFEPPSGNAPESACFSAKQCSFFRLLQSNTRGNPSNRRIDSHRDRSVIFCFFGFLCPACRNSSFPMIVALHERSGFHTGFWKKLYESNFSIHNSAGMSSEKTRKKWNKTQCCALCTRLLV